MPRSGMAPLSWWFLVRLVSALASSGILSLLVWVKSTVGQTIASISSTKTSCIVSSLLMCPERSGVMAEIMGEFLVDSTYSELPLLPSELVADLTSLSVLAGDLGDAF